MSRVVSWITLGLIVFAGLPAVAQSSVVWPSPLVANLEGLAADGSWEPPDDMSTHLFNKLTVSGPPGFWVYPVMWVHVLPPEDGAPWYAEEIYAETISRFPFLATPTPSDLPTHFPPPAGFPTLAVPDAFLTPFLETALGPGLMGTQPTAVRSAWEPICLPSTPPSSLTGAPSPSAAPQTRYWRCHAPVWGENLNLLNQWWTQHAANPTDDTVIDFELLAMNVMVNQTAVIAPTNGNPLIDFFNSGPTNPPKADLIHWYDYAKETGMELMIQFVGLVSTSTAHITTSNETTTGGLTGLTPPGGNGLPPRISWSNGLGVRFYVPRPGNLGGDKAMVNSASSSLRGADNILRLKLRSAVGVPTIRIRDSLGGIFLGSLSWSEPGIYSVQLPTSFPAGAATILRISTSYDTLFGTGQPWATINQTP